MDSETAKIRENFLVFGAPQIFEDEIEEVSAVMRSGWLGTGPKVQQFEHEFAAFKGVQEAAAVNSCTAALHLSLIAANFGPGDEVITTPMTFCATVNTIIQVGATPVLADVNPETGNIDPDEIRKKITPRTRGLVIVHFGGHPCEMDEIMEISRSHNLKLIEDCAHATETEYHGQKTGTFGDFGCFSFYVNKNVITGEGGMILARNPDALARIRILTLHGMSRDAWKRFGTSGYKHYQVVECGYKYNMMDMQAAIGIHHLRRVNDNWRRRREIWNRYTEALQGIPLVLPAPVEPSSRQAHHLFTILIDEERAGISRDDFLNEMTRNNIGVGVHYVSIPEHPFYQQAFGWKPEDWPNAYKIGQRTVSLPLSPRLTEQDVEDVIQTVRRILRKS